MTMLRDHELAQYNAMMYLMQLYRELREVLCSNADIKDKMLLFQRKHHSDIASRIRLCVPNFVSELTAPSDYPQYDVEARLASYLEIIGGFIDYRAKRAELWIAVEEVSAVLDREHADNRARQNALAHHGERLTKALDALRLGSDNIIRTPNSGYVGDMNSHASYIKDLQRKAAIA